jgi:putative endonuclease
MKKYYVYLLSNRRNGTLFIGFTDDLVKRIRLHKKGVITGFAKKYNLKRLVYYEEYDNPSDAISRHKQLKGWRREKKTALFAESNPYWNDLYEEFLSNNY